jgi:gliding motility-associated-like protein
VSVPPTVRGLVGEIFPQLTQVGQPTHFTYYIRPTIRAGDIGFDGVEISTPAGVISVDSLRLDGINQDDFFWVEKEDGLGFEVTFPRKLEPTDSGALLEVVFNAPVLRELGNVFVGKVFNSSKPNEVRQRINPGNAADEIESDMLTVKTSLIKSLVFAPRVGPNPFTPNNDNINDIVNLSYTLLRVTAPIPVSIEIFDLSGKLVKQVYSGDDPIGEYSHPWDGTNNSNRLVPPGIYLYRIAVDVQSEQEVHRGILSVVY